MTGVLLDSARKLTEVWVSRLTLAALLYIASAAVAAVLRWRNALDFSLLMHQLNSVVVEVGEGSAVRLVVIAALGLLAAGGVGLGANALGSVIARLWTCDGWTGWPPPIRALMRWRARLRAVRWDEARARYRVAVRDAADHVARTEAGVAPERAYDLTDVYRPVWRLGRTRPMRPTWIGDRVRELDTGLRHRYDLDLTSVWPALSLSMPAHAAEAIGVARDGYLRAAVLSAWSLLYVPVAAIWPPAILVVAFTAFAAGRRGRATIERYCLLVDAAVVLYAPPLAQELHVDAPDGLTRDVGAELTRRLGEADVA